MKSERGITLVTLVVTIVILVILALTIVASVKHGGIIVYAEDIKTKYNDELIDKSLKDIDYTTKDCIEDILSKTTKILPIDKIKPTELSIIYNLIFTKYCPNYQVKINNLFLNNKEKNHFIIISYIDEHYSYNYKKKAFVKVNNLDLIDNINTGRIGLYLDEFIPNLGVN